MAVNDKKNATASHWSSVLLLERRINAAGHVDVNSLKKDVMERRGLRGV